MKPTTHHIHYRTAGIPATITDIPDAATAWNMFHRIGARGDNPGYPVPDSWTCTVCTPDLTNPYTDPETDARYRRNSRPYRPDGGEFYAYNMRY